MVFRVSCKLGFCISNLASVSAYRLVLGIFNPLAKCKSSCSRYSAVASKYNEGAKMQHVAERSYQVVVAATRDMGIGKDGKLPWKLPSDLKFFKDLTSTTSDPGKKNAVLMGRKTWESIPLQYRPLPGRLNVVLTRSSNVSIDLSENVLLCGSMKSAFELLATSPYSLTIENVFVIGGGQILRETLNAQGCVAIHITEIESDIDCDTFIPAIDFSLFWPWCASCPLVENDIRHAFVTYVRVKNSQLESLASDNMFGSHDASDFRKHDIENFDFLPKMILERHEEYAYQELIQDIVSEGSHSIDGRGTSIFSKFGCQMRFNLRKSFPLFTTKELSWRGVVEELLQFIGGSTDVKVLSERVTHTWDGRIHPESLMCRKEDDLESIDRFQHRQSCARYKGVHTECTGQEFGQLVTVIEKINNRLVDSHVFLSVCNPSVQNTAEFPPGYTFAQFYVVNGELSCQVYQASTEVGHGVPYNVSSYALLTCLIAHVCNHSPGDVTLQFEEAYVDEAHIKSLLELLQRHPKPFPILKINSGKKDIDSFMTSDFELTK